MLLSPFYLGNHSVSVCSVRDVDLDGRVWVLLSVFRYWLMDCRNVALPVKAAGEVFQDAVKAPFLAKFFVLAKRHSPSEAQVRVLCLTDDDINATIERQEQFDIIGSTKDVEVCSIVATCSCITISKSRYY